MASDLAGSLAGRNLIVWDVDEVLANLREIMADRANIAFGAGEDWRLWRDYRQLYTYYHVPVDRWIHALIELRVLEDCDPEPGAREALVRMKAEGLRHAAVTARAWHPDGATVTRDWFARWNFDGLIDHLSLVPILGSKVDAVAKLSAEHGILAYVEDSAPHLQEVMLAAGCDVGIGIIVTQPWNRHWRVPETIRSRIFRVDSAGEIPDLLQRLRQQPAAVPASPDIPALA